MLPLLSLKEKAVRILQNYADDLRKRLSHIKLAINQLENLLKTNHSSNSFYTFKLTRQLYFDWQNWLHFLKEKHGFEEITNLQNLRENMPTKIDYNEALYGMYRLQSTYRLDPAEMSIGLLRGKQYRCKKFGVLEYLMMGSVFYLDEKFQGAERWFKLALENYNNESNSKKFDIFGLSNEFILKLLMKAAQSSGRYKAALEYANKAQNLNQSQTFWHQQIPRLKKLSSIPEVLKPEKPNHFLFKPACRMEYPAKKYLRCHLLHYSPFLQLAPIKMEELNLDPPINIYHNLIHNEEIVLLKTLSNPHLKRSMFFTSANEVIEDFSNLRTCKTMRLKDNAHHNLMKNLNQRVMDATGLDVKDSEELQISNYGIGGHLYEHQDSAQSTNSSFWKYGNRIITALYYLSDVEQGGETVFPYLDLRVHTQKGSLLVWYNLLLNGTCDWRVTHVSCPILKGDKWIATKWLRENAQMFIRPCPLKIKPPQEYNAKIIDKMFMNENL
ncbi:prolyl 4-hydroxylase subunit alpha-2-like [Drosophila rhopaloa]|uniref:procollagen-proline 4-dioxygenase n=1 Tax=Drosophila rhopaloa TaxID=1041015 RepID=A0ABM5H616_DRORH|nr:prolyl 4-hydroxylase subunit alpha-2-like [Drosophila rhopaloa]